MNAADTIKSIAVHGRGSPLRGEIVVPGDKSISHRSALLAGIAHGQSRLRGFLRSEDCLNTLKAMETLGARVHADDHGIIHVVGTGGRFIEPAGPLDMGNSGTGIRLLTGLLAGRHVKAELTGDQSLMSRPMKRIQEPLLKMGAHIELLGEGGRGPIRVEGRALKAITYAMPVASAQVKSCILLAGLFAEGTTVVAEPAPSRDHTEKLFLQAGIPLRLDGLRMELDGFGDNGPSIELDDFDIPGDISSAAFWLVAASSIPGSDVLLRNVGLNPRRTGIVDVLRRMGADISIEHLQDPAGGERRGDVRIRGGKLIGTAIAGEEIPNVIDELPILAVAGAVAEGVTEIRDAGELRVKESDRIAAMASNLRKMNVQVEETPDGMVIDGLAEVKPRDSLPSLGDHRIAMAMAILALHSRQPACITNIACTETSYPGFWADYAAIGGHLD